MGMRLWTLLPAMLAAQGAWAVSEMRLKGPEVSAPVVPEVVRIDLRDLPPAPAWQPGSPIREMEDLRGDEREGRNYPPEPGPGPDPLLAAQADVASPSAAVIGGLLVSVAGQSWAGGSPPDPTGDVGTSHYIQAVNTAMGATVQVFDKAGGAIGAPFLMGSLATGVCASGKGDPIVLYDRMAHRWLMAEIATSDRDLCIYVSQTDDPVTGGFFVYRFPTPALPDYPKVAAWSNAYYVATNEGAPAVYALDRARMLAGMPATSQRFTAPPLAAFHLHALAPASVEDTMVAPQGPGIFMRHRDDEAHNPPGTPGDFLELWSFHVDWTTPANSTFTGPTSIPIADFDSSLCGYATLSCLPQPSGENPLEPLFEPVLWRLHYRELPGHKSLVGTFAVDVTGTDQAGVRWFELRRTTGAWSLYQQGTFAPDATNRWMSSAALDYQGNMALLYGVVSPNTFPGLRLSGRRYWDPLGTLTEPERSLAEGMASSPTNRWGDYASLTVDPVDGCTFWATGEHQPGEHWGTWIAAFRFDGCPPAPNFSLTIVKNAVTVMPKASVTDTLVILGANGFSGPVTLSASGLPSGVTATFLPNPAIVPAGGSVTTTLTLSASAAAVTGNFDVMLIGTAPGLSNVTYVNLKVVGPVFFDVPLQTVKCPSIGNICDSGPLLLGRKLLGPEPNEPNSIHDSCADGSAGTFHVDESLDHLVVYTPDNSPFTAGRPVRVDAQVYAGAAFFNDRLDLYYTGNANSPTWTFLATLTPAHSAMSTLSSTYTLPAGSLQAVRARFRRGGSVSPCAAGSYNDVDDLAFPVSPSFP